MPLNRLKLAANYQQRSLFFVAAASGFPFNSRGYRGQIVRIIVAFAMTAFLSGCVAHSVSELQSMSGAPHSSSHPGKLADIYPVVLRQMQRCYAGAYAPSAERTSYALLVGNPSELLNDKVEGTLEPSGNRATIVFFTDPKYRYIQSRMYHTYVELTQNGANVDVRVNSTGGLRFSSKDVHDKVGERIGGSRACINRSRSG